MTDRQTDRQTATQIIQQNCYQTQGVVVLWVYQLHFWINIIQTSLKFLELHREMMTLIR